MQNYTTTAILLRRTDYGDNDLILSLLTPDKGKISVIAKSAKQSKKRFSGALELFSASKIVCKKGRGRLPFLQEAVLKHPFSSIRSDIRKTAYASYWAELIFHWLEEENQDPELYALLFYFLNALDNEFMPESELNILFQMKFLVSAGISPNLEYCALCNTPIEAMKNTRILFNPAIGGLICEKCENSESDQYIRISKGTVKQLLWLENKEPETAGRLRFSSESLNESLKCLELFIPYHLGKTPRSLKFLQQIR